MKTLAIKGIRESPVVHALNTMRNEYDWNSMADQAAEFYSHVK